MGFRFPERVAHQLDRMELTETDISNSDCILAPFKVNISVFRLNMKT